MDNNKAMLCFNHQNCEIKWNTKLVKRDYLEVLFMIENRKFAHRIFFTKIQRMFSIWLVLGLGLRQDLEKQN